MTNTRSIALGFSLLAASCYAGVGAADDASATQGTESAQTNAAEDGSSSGADAPDACGEPDAGIVPLRRLTRAEYVATVQDLLGVDATDVADAFATDEAIGGFESNNLAPVTRLDVEAYMAAAESIAAGVDLERALPCIESTPECIEVAVASLALRGFRRPATAQELADLTTLWSAVDEPEAGARLVIEALLQSASFLYRPELGSADSDGDIVPLTPWEIASRLSYFVWGTMPDDTLLAAAADGALADADDVGVQVERMMEDPRFAQAVRSFHRQWLGLDRLRTAEKDPALYPEMTASLRDAMLAQTLDFTEQVLTEGDGRFATLMTSPAPIDDPELAALHGIDVGGVPPADQRAGLLTHPSILAAHSNADRQSPILRGKLVAQRLFCTSIPAPPPNVDTSTPQVDPDATTRERFEMHAVDPSCRTCHRLMDPLGFAFLHYDAIGRWQADENGQPIDAVAQVEGIVGLEAPFDGAINLSERIASSDAALECLSRQWLRFGIGRPEGDAEACAIERGYRAVDESDGDIRKLLFALATSDAFLFTRRQELP